MDNYIISFKYNNVPYDALIENCSATELDKKDISIIVEAIIEKQIKYVEGEYVQGLSFQKIESNKEQDKSGK